MGDDLKKKRSLSGKGVALLLPNAKECPVEITVAGKMPMLGHQLNLIKPGCTFFFSSCIQQSST